MDRDRNLGSRGSMNFPGARHSQNKRELAELSPNTLARRLHTSTASGPSASTRLEIDVPIVKKARKPDSENSVYAIQKEALLREVKNCTQIRRQLEEQVLALKVELRNKTEQSQRISPQLEEQNARLLAERDELAALLALAEHEVQARQDQITRITSQLNDAESQIGEFENRAERLRFELETANDRHSNTEETYRAMEKAFQVKETELSEISNELNRLHSLRSQEAAKAATWVSKYETLASEHSMHTEDKVKQEHEIERLRGEISMLTAAKLDLTHCQDKLKQEWEESMHKLRHESGEQMTELKVALQAAEIELHAKLNDERLKLESAKQQIIDTTTNLQEAEQQMVAARHEKEALQVSFAEHNALTHQRIDDLDAELSELRPKYKSAKDTCTRQQAEMKLLKGSLSEQKAVAQSLKELDTSQRKKLKVYVDEIRLYDSQRTELALALEREMAWREQLGTKLANSETLCQKLQFMLDSNSADFEKQTHELHAKIEQLSNDFEGSQLKIALMKNDIEEFRLKERQSTSDAARQRFQSLNNQRIQELESALANQERLLRQEQKVTRRLQNQVQELKGNIRIVARVRPGNSEGSETSNVDMANVVLAPHEVVLHEVETAAHGAPRRKSIKVQFDRVFGPEATNTAICEEVEYLIQSALDGRNVCIFAYGQTGSGKTYTMSGEEGITSYALQAIMTAAANAPNRYSVRVESAEIYNENIYDLLADSPKPAPTSAAVPTGQLQSHTRPSVQIGATTGQPELCGVKRVPVKSLQSAQKIFEQATRNRSTAATYANQRSSRSHFLFTIRINTEHSQGVLHLVDLAGSERLSHSRAEDDRLRETQAINTSLSNLGNVINALVNKRPSTHIPYRSSKLTYLLQGSLSGGAKTMLLTTLSPEKASVEETKSTLRFADKASRATLR